MKTLVSRLVVLGLAALALMLASASAAQEQAPLAGSQWQLVSYGAPDAPTPVIDGSTVTLQFDAGGGAGGSGGCNSYGGSYTVEGSAITFGPIASTLMACLQDGIGEQEQAYFEALQAASGYEISGDRLVISYGNGQQLVFARLSTLGDSQWRLVSYGAPDAPTPVIDGSTVTLQFGADGQAGGSGGCNRYSGSYTVEGSAMAFGPVVRTEMACLQEGLGEQEQAYFEALQAASGYEISADRLVISYGDGQQLTFERVVSLADSQWELRSYGAADAPTPVTDGSTVTLQFDAGGQASGSGGCNRYSGSYSIEGSAITFGPIVSTRMACPDLEQEQAYFEALQAASGYEVSSDRLVIVYGDGQQLVFQRAATMSISQ